MPEEIKDVIHTKEERELGLKLVNKYSKDASGLFDAYLASIAHIEKERHTMTLEEYKKKRDPYWKKYQEDDKALYDEYVENAEALGYRLKVI